VDGWQTSPSASLRTQTLPSLSVLATKLHGYKPLLLKVT